ncbi:hypothetical protein B0H67DRAFT_129327 [Lasiosphaeris hirsuta]|uniref:Uncharacterized protein n=1 Tax=Lasiosphaeris hirsuta TaxID=260670 RepID=A0AA40B0D6_9PEZI|nr:hypothetical protein B0H67DRAFT_129327 [Lasiosphaeris hirsuta]
MAVRQLLVCGGLGTWGSRDAKDERCHDADGIDSPTGTTPAGSDKNGLPGCQPTLVPNVDSQAVIPRITTKELSGGRQQ